MQSETVPAAGTGLPELDRVLTGLLPGDNVVWQVDAVEDYLPFVRPFVSAALAQGRRLVYFRFARHPELVPEGIGARIHRLSADAGFETFTARIHRAIEEEGRGACYVFDCLSDLAADWYSDLMLGNFFMVTCPYLYELETYTYFALLRDSHSVTSVSAIRETTQLLLDVFRRDGLLYVHPLKVDGRHSPTMYLPHAWKEDAFLPLTESASLSDVLAEREKRRADAVPRTLDMWDRLGAQPEGGEEFLFPRYLRMMVTRDERLIGLATRWLDLSDLLAIRRRMIGTGLIGGKSVGMLLARAILTKADPAWKERLETHDSFFIGSDVFYTFLVRNGCWHARREQRNPDTFLVGAEAARERVRTGAFPKFIVEQFVAMLEYFGQSPIIVRSSSLLEDSFGNAFTGKYESVFCPNQGSPQERLDAFLSAVRTVYASTMSREALLYRAHRGLIDRDEQMAVLVQRVSGGLHGDLFYPQVAGVGLSYNPYVWSEHIDPAAGVLRLVFGLGTRAVERSDDDYTRMVALNAPLRRPDTDRDRDGGKHSQRRMDLLDLSANRFAAMPIDEVLRMSPDLPVELYAARRGAPGRDGSDARRGPEGWMVAFDRLLSDTPFVPEMRRMLQVLRDAYECPVDTEFTANFLPDGRWRINLVQCRPLQVKEGGKIVEPPKKIPRKSLVLETRGPIIGRSSLTRIRRVVYVDPAGYAAVPVRERASVARLVGRVLHAHGEEGPPEILLLGPGRWGTSTPSLGVPVSFAEIDTASVICEVVSDEMEVVPDVSLGTHFFNDLVEADMLYMAVRPGRGKDFLNRKFLVESRNLLPDLLPDDAEWAGVVRVVDPSDDGGLRLFLNADSFRQRAVCYLANPAPEGGTASHARTRTSGAPPARQAG
ncbi:MAG: PEP/pyruvate-binding domain-containing protein [Thermodesulfobacteriota bacterium]